MAETDTDAKAKNDEERDGFAVLREAAVQAEFETGLREQSVAEAKASLVKRAARVSAGLVVTIVGIALLPLPGPGWLIIVGGLSILAKDFPFLARWITEIRRRVPGIPEDGAIPRRTKAIIAAIVIGSAAASIWYSMLGGDQVISDVWHRVFG